METLGDLVLRYREFRESLYAPIKLVLPNVSEEEKTIAHLFQDQGYTTHMIGKWHLGFTAGEKKKEKYDFTQPFQGGPMDRGFDSYFGIPSSPGAFPLFFIRNRRQIQIPTEHITFKKTRATGKVVVEKGLKSPDYVIEHTSPILCKKAVDFIKKYAESEQQKPFFLYYASTVPHTPWVPTKEFRGKSGLGDYGDFMLQLDSHLGQINTALKDTGLADNTLLIFTSDNGAGPIATKLMSNQGHQCAGILRGYKSLLWEGGHRIPFIAKWPGKIPAGSASYATINGTDLFATFAEYFGIALASTYPSVKDSHSFLTTLMGEVNEHTRPPMINGCYSIRKDQWKLVSSSNLKKSKGLDISKFNLYNLTDDLSESNDISKENPEKTKELFKKLEVFKAVQKLK